LFLVVVKNPADFVGSVLGESEKNTKAILKATEGKVLIIDEAYMLYSGGAGMSRQLDLIRHVYPVTFRTSLIFKALSSLGFSVFGRLCGTRPSCQTPTDGKSSMTRRF